MARHNDTGRAGEDAAVEMLTAKGYAIVDRRKQLAMVRAATAYVEAFDLPHELQFDIVGVSGTPGNFTIEHIEDAFAPPLTTY